MLNSAVYVKKRSGKKTTSESDAKCVIIVLCQVGKNLRWDWGLLSLQLTQWSDASFIGSKQVSDFVPVESRSRITLN